jgi:hypothetical protein
VQAATAQASGPRVWLLLERPLPGEPGDPRRYVLNRSSAAAGVPKGVLGGYYGQSRGLPLNRRKINQDFPYG